MDPLAPPRLTNDDPRAHDRAIPLTALGTALAWSPARRELVLLTSEALLWVDVVRGSVRWVGDIRADHIEFSAAGLLLDGKALLVAADAAPRSTRAKPITGRWPRSSPGATARFGKRVAMGTKDKQIEVTGKGVRTALARVGRVDTLTFTPDGESLVVANHAHVCKRWEWRTGKARATFTGHGDFVRDMEFLDEQHLVTACYDGGLRLWEAASGACLGAILATHDGRWLAVAPDGTMESSPGLPGVRYGYRENAPPGHRAFRIDAARPTAGVVQKIFCSLV